jgi:hypothetical protein
MGALITDGMRRLARALGCTEGQAYTVVIGLILGILLAATGIPQTIGVEESEAPAALTPSATPAPPTDAPDLTTPTPAAPDEASPTPLPAPTFAPVPTFDPMPPPAPSAPPPPPPSPTPTPCPDPCLPVIGPVPIP